MYVSLEDLKDLQACSFQKGILWTIARGFASDELDNFPEIKGIDASESEFYW